MPLTKTSPHKSRVQKNRKTYKSNKSPRMSTKTSVASRDRRAPFVSNEESGDKNGEGVNDSETNSMNHVGCSLNNGHHKNSNYVGEMKAANKFEVIRRPVSDPITSSLVNCKEDQELGVLLNSNAPKFDKKDEEIVLQPFRYVYQVPGKMIREQLSQAFNYWMKIPSEKLAQISNIVSILHNASLLIDDIEDKSVLRRGIPVAHLIYGVPSTINSANYVYFLGLQKTLELQHPQAVAVFCEQLLELHMGQGLDIHWRDSFTCPTEEQYKQMTIRKTGGLFGLATRLMQLFSNNSTNFTQLTDILGLYFQIRDDYANLTMKEYSDSKTYCEDLTEGKFSFPVVHAIHSRSDCNQIISIVRQRPTDVEVKKYCVSLLEKYGSLAYTRHVMHELDRQARVQIEKCGGNPLLEKILDSLKNWDRD